MGRHPKGLLEGAREMGFRHPAHPGKPRDGPLFLRCGGHAILGAEQAPQQLRVLELAHLDKLAAAHIDGQGGTITSHVSLSPMLLGLWASL